MNLKSVSVWMVFGLFITLPLMGVVSAQGDSGDRWGFEMNIDMHKEFGAYLDVLADTGVSYLNSGLQREGGKYSVDSHYSNIGGNVKFAAAVDKTGNTVNFQMGQFSDLRIALGMNGTFPDASTLKDVINYPENASAGYKQFSSEIISREKLIVDGTCQMDEEGNIESMNMNIHYESSTRIKGNSMPISALPYSIAKSKSVDYEWDYKYARFIFSDSSTESRLVFTAVDVEGDVEFSSFSLSDSNLNLTYMDLNGNGRIDIGDKLIIEGSPSYLQSIEDDYGDIVLHYADGENYRSIYISYCCGSWTMDSLNIHNYKTITNPKMQEIMNETEDMPLYDNVDFTIHVVYDQTTHSTYSPHIPLASSEGMEVNKSVSGTYSGEIEISGLKEEYMDIIETLMNRSFPIYIQNLDTHSDYYNNGTIQGSTTVYIPSLHVEKTMEYGGETVQVISLMNNYGYMGTRGTGQPYQDLGMSLSTSPIGARDIYYYYSPSKHFIVGFGVDLGIKKFETSPTSYEDAKREINDVQSQDTSKDSVSEGGGFPLTLIIIAVAAIIAVIAGSGAYVWHRKKTKMRDMQMQAQPEQQYPPQYTEQQPVQPMQPEQPQDLQPEQGTEPQTQGDEEQFF